ncbi:MAG: ATPase domain-containing protein, partial [archaeon]|nr:ATPase domain-containing protein [archaeon]
QGGLPEGRSFLVSGATGTGKSIFCTQFVYAGATQFRQPGVYVTLDERPNLLREDMLSFGWDLRKLEDDHLLEIIDGSVAKIGLPSEEEFAMPTGFDLDKLLLEIVRTTRRIGAKRLVIDSLPALGFNYDNANDVRKAILKISYMLERTGVTSLLVSEMDEGAPGFSRFGVEEFVADGVFVMHYLGVGTQSNRTLHIRKLRATHHSEQLHPLEITPKGIVIKGSDTQLMDV